MSVTRRQFLLSTAGAAVGAIMPSFYFRALEYFERFGSPLLLPPERVTEDLVVVTTNDYPELCLGDPFADVPEMTYREYFTRFEPEGFQTFEEQWGMGPEGLDLPLDEEHRFDIWFREDGPSARAYHWLQSLDLGPGLSGPNAAGGVDFREEYNMVSSWLVASPQDEVTLSLLQQRLTDLGTGVRVVIGPTL